MSYSDWDASAKYGMVDKISVRPEPVKGCMPRTLALIVAMVLLQAQHERKIGEMP
jgi:hypothetical protein